MASTFYKLTRRCLAAGAGEGCQAGQKKKKRKARMGWQRLRSACKAPLKPWATQCHPRTHQARTSPAPSVPEAPVRGGQARERAPASLEQDSPKQIPFGPRSSMAGSSKPSPSRLALRACPVHVSCRAEKEAAPSSDLRHSLACWRESSQHPLSPPPACPSNSDHQYSAGQVGRAGLGRLGHLGLVPFFPVPHPCTPRH